MILLLDGAMSAQLLKFGFDCLHDENKPHFSFLANKDLELMEKVYKSFIHLGVNVITTNTYHYGSTLDKNIPENESRKELYLQYFKNTCDLLCKLAGSREDVQVMGSVGTFATLYHDCSEYSGVYMDRENAVNNALEYYRNILSIFQEYTTIRKLVFETIPSSEEGLAALEVLREFPEMTAVMSFTYKENGCLRHGEKIHDVAEKLQRSNQILGIGVNCTDPENVLPALLEIQKFQFQNVFVYPNIGDSKFLEGGYNNDHVFNKKMIKDWAAAGATAIGGCCGVTDDEMLFLKAELDEANQE